MNKKQIFIFICLTAACLLVGGCGQKKKDMVSKKGFFFDTMISVSILCEEQEQGEHVLDKAFAKCAEYEDIFSRTKENSELYRLNHRTESGAVVSEDLYALLSCAKEYYEVTGGRFDISVAPLSDLWDFKNEDPKVPDEGEIKKTLEKVGYSRVYLEAGDRVKFDDPDTMLDLGALAKGYIADRLKEYLVSEGIESGYINLGGNVLTIGEKEDGSPWEIGIQKPFAERNEIVAYVDAAGSSVVSSGIYERYFEADGKLYYHVLDPETGYPVETDLAQVTILSKSSLEGDALSTSCLILGYEKGRKLIENTAGVEAVFVRKDGKVEATDGVELKGDGKD